MEVNYQLPNRNGAGANEAVKTAANLVVIGANGSGKSRLGGWVERNSLVAAHRLSAQRALSIPEFAPLKNLEQASNELFYGHQTDRANKHAHRWQRHPETTLLNDYSQLLSTLFARSAKRDAEHTELTRQTGAYQPVPNAPIDIIVEAWGDIMPHREIAFIDGKVLTNVPGQAAYHGQDMSDGERVCLYLLGQCLCAPENSLIIIDEPELHLHRSLMVRLWNKIEEVCPDKVFVYITHDLDFAASRKDARKIWLKSYNTPDKWVWDDVPDVDEIPEALVLEILGSRKPIIFCEGDRSSNDSVLYQAVYPEYHIIPRGGCDKVIESTKAMRGNASLHHLKSFGVIDRDYRQQDEIEALEKGGVFTADVAEIENLFCIEPLVRIVASHLGIDPDRAGGEAAGFILGELAAELELQIANHAEREIQFLLGAFTKTEATQQGLVDGFGALIASIDVPSIFAESKGIFDGIMSSGDVNSALRHYNRKTLAKRISKVFGLKDGEFVKLVIRLLKTDKKDEIVAALKAFAPNIE